MPLMRNGSTLVIRADGIAEINANGLTGNPDTTLGRVSPSTPYSLSLIHI